LTSTPLALTCSGRDGHTHTQTHTHTNTHTMFTCRSSVSDDRKGGKTRDMQQKTKQEIGAEIDAKKRGN
jgi:hypothetical protein